MKPPRADAKNMHAIVALFDTPRPTGLQRKDMARLIPGGDIIELQKSVSRMLNTGRLFRAGARGHHHYFLTAEARDVAAGAIAAEHQAFLADRADRIREQSRRSQRKIRAARAEARAKLGLPPLSTSDEPTIERNPPPIKPLKGRTPEVMVASDIAERRAKQAGKSKAPVEVVIPDSVQVQRAPSFRGDPRYMVEGPVVGGFATMGVGRYLERA